MEKSELKKRLSNIKELPTLPIVANNVIQLTQNPDSTAFEIAEAISLDQSLASRVLKTANSAYYGFPRKITTINYAIVVLGLNNIKNIVLSASIMEQFSRTGENLLLDRRDFWKHSLLCGIISKKISEHMRITNSEEMFMCGLLHDFGKMILDGFFHDEFVLVLKLSNKKNFTMMEAENKIFGFNHSGVGALLLRRWSLPPSLVKAVEFHHSPDKSLSAFRIASIVHVADYLCRRIGIGSGGDNVLPDLNKKAFKLVELTSKQINKMSLQITKEFKAATGFLYEGKEDI
ncbi:MAG: HDOD domain-containing protein [Deltaproteobacteria bacterium]|nr:HDOD domain-containing protein [Deltaproteobacteria bacterium]